MKKVLVVVDYQNDFVDGSLATVGGKEVYNGVLSLVKEFLDAKNTIIATLDTHDDSYLSTQEGKKLPIKHCIKGTVGHELYGDLKKLQNDMICLEKTTFGSLDLASILKGMKATDIYFCGLVTDICIISNVVIAKTACPDAKVTVYQNLTEGLNIQKKQSAFDVMESLQVNVESYKYEY